MTVARVLRLGCVLLAMVAVPASADEWIVTAVRPPATVAAASGAWVPLQAGSVVPDGSWVSTGRRGRLTLQRNEDIIQLRPGSVASISLPESTDALTAVVKQKFGTLLFDVETRPSRTFRVETPFLAAIVKGTRFEMSVGRTQARLSVEEGKVDAIDIAAGLSATVQQGQSAVLNATTPQSLILSGPGPTPAIVKVAPSRPVLAPAITPAQAAAAAAAVPVAPVPPVALVPPVAPVPPVAVTPVQPAIPAIERPTSVPVEAGPAPVVAPDDDAPESEPTDEIGIDPDAVAPSDPAVDAPSVPDAGGEAANPDAGGEAANPDAGGEAANPDAGEAAPVPEAEGVPPSPATPAVIE